MTMNNVQDLIDDLNSKDFDYYLEEMMEQVPNDIDKREGSIVYDAIAPAAMVMSVRALDMANYLKQAHIETATGEFLDSFASDRGTNRESATYTKVKANIIDDNKNVVTSVDINDTFASVANEPIFYHVIAKNDDGTFILQANDAGSYANQYVGQIIPVTANDSVSWAEITEVSVPAKDAEDDESLRSRLLSPNSYIAYGGNVADYKKMIEDKLNDVGAVQVYSAWQGGGTVKLVILDNTLNLPTKTLINEVQNVIDPVDNSALGYGLAPIGHKVTVVSPDLLNISVNIDVVSDNKVSKDLLNNAIKNSINNYFVSLRKSWDKSSNNHYDLTVYRSQILAVVLQTEHVVNAELPKLNGNESDIELTFNNSTSQLPVIKDVVIND
ncbi:baseplate J/gp47 family protein [Apilactobacillus sp. EABW-1NA]|uniref:baseplate J/gp47 family protein n=1 Tax=Apilactobacillus sp. EABW-1NA TaxID=2984137 RepID=UPI0025B1C766|nr:baseplate J/gp47 family protein [Apilactobacillus sp. EABW-1NA]MDN2612965.1 baseplate J/gp47 family protein [Apilactobacillus sp. EABW-1NA]